MKKILISTNMYKGSEFGQILPYLKRFPGQVGVEVFPIGRAPPVLPRMRRSYRWAPSWPPTYARSSCSGWT